MLHSMTIRLIHVHQVETLYLYYGVKCQPGVICRHRGQKVIFNKNATSATEYMVVSLLYSLGQGQLGITSSGKVSHL